MEYRNFTIQDQQGNVLSGASVAVYEVNTTTQAAVYDESGGALTQPLRPSSLGIVGFAAANGVYDIVVTNGASVVRYENEKFLDVDDEAQVISDAISAAKQDSIDASVAAANAAVAPDLAAAATSEANAAVSETNAAISEANAAASEASAAASAASSAAARDAATVNADVYDDEATGRAAVVDGEQFQVISADGDELIRYQRVDAGSSAEVARYPSGAAFNETENARAQFEDHFTDALTSSSEVLTGTAGAGRVHSPSPLADLAVTPLFEGFDLDVPVAPSVVAVTGKNIVDASPSLWEPGLIDAGGNNTASGSRLRTAGFIPVQPNTQYSRRGGPYGLPSVYLYDSAGTFVREIDILVGTSDVWVTAANETQMRLWFVKSGALPTDAADAEIQIEASAVPTTFEAFRTASKVYDAGLNLYGYSGVNDTVRGNNLVRRIERRTIVGTAAAGSFHVTGSVSNIGTDYYRMTLGDPVGFLTQTKDILIGRSDDGDYAVNAGSATEARGIWDDGVDDARITIEKAKVDLEAGATTVDKFKAYLDAHPVEVIFDRGGWATSETVARGLAVLPKNGSVLIDATGATTYDVEFREIASVGGANLTARVTALEGSDTSQAALIGGLQSQIDALTVSGDSSVEAAAARTSSLGMAADASLKARLDRMEENAGVVSVRDFGAVGDGVTDDTDAIRAAKDAAEANDMALHFPPCADHYMIHGGILLTKSTRVTGALTGPIKKLPAYTSGVKGAISIGDTVIPVADASGFTVGFDVYVGPPDSTPSYNGTRGTITAVDTVNDTITIEAYNNDAGTGIRVAFADGEAVASTTFPMIYTDHVVSGDTPHISPEIIGVHLNGNAQPGEPNSYPCSLIHFDQRHVVAPLTYRCELRNSPADAVSDQGDGCGLHARNRMYSNAWHGIHIGFTNSGTEIVGNYANGNGRDGVYYCFGNTNTRSYGNFFENMPFGFCEVGGQSDGDTVITGNVTKNCAIDYELSTLSVGAVIVNDFLSIGNTDHVVVGDTSRRAKISGVARGGSGTGIEFTRASEISIDVDFFDWAGPYCVDIRNVSGARSREVSVRGQAHGATTASVRVQSSDDCLIALDISKPGAGAADIVIDAAPGQPAPNDTHVGFGIRKGSGVLNSGVNTVLA